MIIKGKCRTNGGQLGEYLGNYLKSDKNDNVELIELRGSAYAGLTNSIASWEAEAKATKCKKALWHAQIAPTKTEFLTREQKIEAVDILEKHLGFTGQPRAIVMHRKDDGSEHLHVVWSRIDRATKKARRDDFSHKKNVAASREIEERFGLQKVDSPDFKKDGTRQERREKSKKAANQKDFQKAKRSSLDPRERQKTITAIWEASDSGKALRAGLEDAGYVLAYGDRRKYVVVDQAQDIHELSRQIKGALAKDVSQKLRDVDPASIPHVEHVRNMLWRKNREQQMSPQPGPTVTAQPVNPPPAAKPASASPRFDEPNRYAKSLDPADILADMTQRQSTFTKGDLTYKIGKRLKEELIADPMKVAKIIGKLADHKDFVALGADRYGTARYTSRDMLNVELNMLDSAKEMSGCWNHGVRSDIKDASPTAKTLSAQQKDAFNHLTRAEGLSLAIGYAGTGKSYLMKAANEAWVAQGYRVRGLAVAGIAAASLQEGSGLQSTTLQSFFYSLEKLPEQEEKLRAMSERQAGKTGKTVEARRNLFEAQANRDKIAARIDATRLTSRDVIVLDEAGMVGSRQMNQLLTLAREAGAKVVMIGDAEQLQAIDAGGSFRALADRFGAVKISEVRRQEAEWQKTATRSFGDGFTADALASYKDAGHIHQHKTKTEAREKVIEAWTASRAAHLNETHLMMAYTRDDVAGLNRAAREVYKKEGRLGIDDTVSTHEGGKEFARGDRLYFLENKRLDSAEGKSWAGVKVKNGTLGTVEKLERDSLNGYHRFTVKLDGGEMVKFSTDEYAKFTHGFASTIHKSQGSTCDRSHILASQFMDRHGAYVAMTRHRKQVDLHYSEAEFKDYGGMVKQLSRDRRKDTTLDYLDRDERIGSGHRLRNLAKEIIEILTLKKPVDRMAEALRMRKLPAAMRQVEEEKRREAARQAKLLREIIGGRPLREKTRSYGRSM